MDEDEESSSRALECKLLLVNEEIKKAPTEVILRALNSCHEKMQCQTDVKSLQEDCDRVEASLFSLLGQLKLYDTSDVLNMYKELVDAVVRYEHTQGGPRLMSTEFESPPVADCSDVMKYFKMDYVKNADPLLIDRKTLGFSKDKCFDKINATLQKAEEMLASACDLRELSIEELFENDLRKLHNPIITPETVDDPTTEKKKMSKPSKAKKDKQMKKVISEQERNPATMTLEEDDEMKDDLLFHTHIQPTDLLRCLLDELSSRGLVLKAAEHKLGLIQRDPRACSPSSLFEKPVVIELLGPDVVESGSKKSNGTKTLKSGKSSEKSVKTTTILTPVNDAVDYQSLGFYMEKQLQKPVGIPAAGLVIESSEGSRDITKAFDAAWLNGKNEATERQFQQWVGLTAKRSELQQLPPITSLEQVPHVAELITNPFGSCSIVGDKGGSVSDATPQPEVEWEWLTSLPDHAITAEKIYQFIHSGEELRRSDLSALESEVDHPFINQNSILYGQVNLKQCLSQNLLQDLERGFPLHVSSNMKFVDLPFLIQNQSGDLNNPQCLQDSPLFLALQPVDRANPVSTDAEFADARRVLYGAHMSSLRLGVYFERNVTRALHLLGLGLNILLVDGCTREVADAEAENLCSVPTSVKNLSYLESSLPSIVPDSFHRAFMLSTIIKRCVFNSIPHGEESGGIDEGVPCHGHGPILIVCRIGELLDFQDILQRECDASSDSNSIMRLLPYYGDATDREVLRSYMLPENIYSSRSHCHIVLTHYEAFTQDLFYFKGINWYLMVVDSFWGILSNKIYRKVRNEIATVNCRHRIISCASLGHVSNKATSPDSVASSTVTDTADTACQSKTTLYPDISSTLSFLLPVMWSLLESQEQPYGKTIEGEFVMSVQTRRLCLQLLAALTVVHNASLDDLVTEHVLSAHSKSNSRASLPHEVKLFNDASEWLPWYIWDCVSLKVVDVEVQHQQLEGADSLQNDTRHISKKIIYTFDYSVKYTRFYSDMELDSEMKSVKLDTVGNPDSSLRKRVRKKPGPKGAVSLPTKETKSTITESRRSSSAIKGEGVVGVSVVEVKVKRPYNMAKRRAIKQGLLPPVSGGETRGRRGKRRNMKDFGIVRQVMADLVSKVAHDTEETTCEKDTVVDSKLEQCPPFNIDSVEVKEETEKSADGGDVGARMEVEPESVWEEIHSENIKIDVVAATTTSASEDKAELKCVNEKLKPLVVVSEHKGDKVVVSEYVIDQDNVNNENGDFHEHLEDDHTVGKKNEEEIHKDSVIKKENERQVGETVLPQPWSLYSSSLGDTTEDGALKRSAVEISATGCDIEKTDTSNAREIEETIVSSASSSVGDSSNGDIRLPPAKKPKLTYYQRKKEAEYEKALASGVLPPNMLKKQGKKSFDRDGTYLPLKLKVVAVKKYSPKEERERSLFGRGNRVQVVINFPGRQRFLGSFKTLAEAEKAYNAALAQRFTLLTTGKSGLTRLRLVGGGGADKNHQSLILQQAGVPKKKTSSTSNNIPEFCNDVDLVRKVHDEVLVHAVRDMLHPLLAVKSIPLGDWETDLTPVHSMHAPPAFAKLHGPGGFVAYIHTRSSCVLGKYYKDTINLSKKFGINDPIGIGHGLGGSLRFDHQVSSRCQERPGHVDIHLGDDTSIARQHADIRFNKQTNFFELCALHETATVFVQGMRVTRVSGYVTINPQCVIQLGSRIFRFLYPTSSPHVSQGTKNLKSADQFQVQPHPLEYKKGLLNVLLSVVKLRRKGFSMEGYPSASAAAHFSSFPLSEVEQADVQSAFHECELAVEKALPSIVHSQADIVEGGGSNSSERKHFKTSANGGGNFANAPEEFVGVYKSTAKNKAILRNLQDVEAAADLERSSLLQTLSSTPVFESNHERQQQHKKRAKEGDECEQATETAVKKMKTMSNNDC